MNKLFSRSLLTLTASASALALLIWAGSSLQGCGDGTGFFKNLTLCDVPLPASLDSQTRIGGSANVVTLDKSESWAFYNVANELIVTPVDPAQTVKYGFTVTGFILDVDIVEYPLASGTQYALLAMGDKGIAVVNVTDPANMIAHSSVHVNYEQSGITFTDGGGNIIPDNTISGVHAPITSLILYNDASGVDQLIIADEAYGLHKTKLANLFDTVAGREADGTLLIDDGNALTVDEIYTLQYAGENPWGGPKSLALYKNPTIPDDKGSLFVAMGFLGMGIFDPETLTQVGRYNLYTDASVVEDWFIDMVVADEVQPGYIDAFTGMPDYRQAAFEVTEAWKNSVDAPTPWAEFDRYGKHYYDVRKVDVATFNNGTTIAYVAYALAGMVAVDVTGYDAAGPYDPLAADPFADFLTATYLGYAPAVPANGPDVSTGATSSSLYPHFGSGMLKEAGIVDVKVDIAGNRVFFSDHFAGLVAIGNAYDPSTWHGSAAPYDNDVLEPFVLGDHWPDYEFVTSYDMTPYDPLDNESLPAWMFESPALLVTGEINGHGNAFLLMSTMNAAAAGQVDVVAASGGGGVNFVDITDINNSVSAATDDGFEVLLHMATTDEVYREADGSTTTGLSVGHSAGVASYHNLLFLADGPHGMTVWQIADAERCLPTDEVHVLANTLQDEYPVDTGTEVINPAPHAYDVILDTVNQKALVMSQSRGLRRVSVDMDGLDTAAIPVLLKPQLSDIYEHNTAEGSVGGLRMQDHAYDAALDGNLAFVADGSNGLTVYDLDKDPSAVSDYVVGNIGGQTRSKPALGHATAVALWSDSSDAGNIRKYAFVAAGHAGIGVVDVTDAANMVLVKVFEPIKLEEEDGELKIGKADGRSVDVLVVEDHVYFTYDSFGILAYTIADLIKPLPEGMDPTDIWEPATIGERPEAVVRFKLQDPLLGGSAELADLGGGALAMFHHKVLDQHLFYIAYGTAGVIKLDWTDVTAPLLLQHADTAGEASDIEVINGRAYVADGAGGLVLMK